MHMNLILNRLRRHSFSTFESRMGDNSFVNLGRNYEEKCKKVLSKLFAEPVKMVGGANDGGIDLTWSKSIGFNNEQNEHTANKVQQVQFIGQCKVKVNNRVAPEVCRALDGVLSKRPPLTIGCLISNFRPSVNAMKSIKESPFPQIVFNISEYFECEYVKEIFVNEQFKELFPNVKVYSVKNPARYTHYILKFE